MSHPQYVSFVHVQAFVVAGGLTGLHNSRYLSSVLTLLRGATSWIPLAPLPRKLFLLRASIVGGRLRLSGGLDEVLSSKAEVMINDH